MSTTTTTDRRTVEVMLDLPEGWRAEAVGHQRGSDRPVLVRLCVEWPASAGEAPPSGITNAVMRTVKLSEIVDQMESGLGDIEQPLGWLSEIRDAWGPARQRQPDRQYALLAYFYDRAVRDGVPPKQRLMDLMTPATRSTVDVRLKEARRRGFLGAASPGMPGGGMTQQAMTELGAVTRPPAAREPSTHKTRAVPPIEGPYL